MSFGQNLAVKTAQLINLGQVVELLLDEKGELIDYSQSYPFFQTSKRINECIQYGIYSLKSAGSGKIEISSKRFLSAERAEDYLLELEFSDFHPYSAK